MKYLVLGGVRSGKSRLAESIAKETGLKVCYIATSQPLDKSMQDRIEHHQQSRPADWGLIEEPLKLAQAIQSVDSEDTCILIDCLTLWLTNLLMLEYPDEYTDMALAESVSFKHERQALLNTLDSAKSTIVLVSNETSMGVVPMGELTRRFCDEAGWLHQDLANVSDKVILTVAGLPHYLKGAAA